MKLWKFRGLFKEHKWLEPGFVMVDGQGLIVDISDNILATSKHDFEEVEAWALPGFVNAHSHAFQYAMAGLTEMGSKDNSFWSWRKHMYQLALKITPDQMFTVAQALYSEMLKKGFIHTVEFHYLHHDSNGSRYSNPLEMSEALISAAQDVGMGLTLVPVYYNQGGFNLPAQSEQRRFLFESVEDYLNFCDQLKSRQNEHFNLGLGIHSLRAGTVADNQTILEHLPVSTPFHIHISEQLKEVSEAKRFLNQTPVSWLLDQNIKSQNVNLVHATHISHKELTGIVSRKWNVVLCPSTEGNLADGFFPLRDFHSQGGLWTIGTDSHVGLDPLEELRWLDYGQRLNDHSRSPFAASEPRDGGTEAFVMAISSGYRSAGLAKPFQIGSSFSALLLDSSHPFFQTSEALLSKWIYSPASQASVWGLLQHGRWIIEKGTPLVPTQTHAFTKLLRSLWP